MSLITPDKLELPPLHELNELCDSLGYFVKEKSMKWGDKVHGELSLQLQDVLLVPEGQGPNRKTAKGDAAFLLLKDLEKRGISKSCHGSKIKRDHPNHLHEALSQDEHSLEPVKHKRTKVDTANSPKSVSNILLLLEDSDSNFNTPVITSINMRKGGPRSTFYKKQDLQNELAKLLSMLDETRQQASPFFSELKQKLLLSPSEATSADTCYNVPLINSLVLFVGMQLVPNLDNGWLCEAVNSHCKTSNFCRHGSPILLR